MRIPSLLVAAALLLGAANLQAQTLSLHIQDGQVTLHAQNVSLIRILEEWARVANATIVNVDRLPGGLVTLDLVDVNERAALDTVLRNVVGYILAERQSGPGTSTFDRILILPTSAPPPNSALPSAAPANNAAPANTAFNPTPTLRPDAAVQPVPPSVEPSVLAIGQTPADVRSLGAESSQQPSYVVEAQDPPGIVSERSMDRANRMVGSMVGAASPPVAPTLQRSVPANQFGVSTGSAQPGTIAPVEGPPSPGRSPSEDLPDQPQ